MNFTITRVNGGVIAWTEDQVSYIIDKYVNENYSLKKLSNQFSCAPASIRLVLNRNGVHTNGNKQGYPRNELYFNSINTPEKAYWLGFLYADGCVHSGKAYVISMNITDKEQVEKFKTAIGAVNHLITETKDDRWRNAKVLYQFSIKDKQLHSDLIKWGCVPKKTFAITKIPNIPKDYISHFIRGYFDGDGSLHWLQNTNNYRISFTSGSQDFLKDILKELDLSHLSIQKQKDHNTYCL